MKKLYSSLCRDVFSPELNSETLKTNFGHASGLSRSFINDPLFLVLGVKQELCEGIEKLLDSGEQKSCGNDIPETAPDELSVFNPVNMRRASGESPINPVHYFGRVFSADPLTGISMTAPESSALARCIQGVTLFFIL